MKYPNIKRLTAGLLLALTILVSCKKFIEIPPPETQAEISKVFSSDATATSAAVGLYYQMTASNLTMLNGAITVYGGLSADEISNPNPNSDYDAFKNNSLVSNNGTVNSRFWTSAYRYIYQANAVLEGLDRSTAVSQALKDQLRGEMLFSRALNYFYLVNLFGDVPLITVTDYTKNSNLPRTGQTAIYQQLIGDLSEAKELLTASYASSTNLRPNKMAAAALLARVYLYQKDWVNAEKLASEVMSGNYTLETDPNQVFSNTSGETILQLARPTANTAEGFTFIPASPAVKPTFAITSSLNSAFETGDLRRSAWMKTNTVSGTPYTYPYKYKIRNSTTVSEYYVVVRLAEVYLIRAEARAEQQKLSDALTDLNAVRQRAGLTVFNTISQSVLLSAIMKERQTELFAEWGHRWLDLKRSGQANTVLSTLKGSNWQNTDVLFPVPFDQIKLNPSLTQNPGY